MGNISLKKNALLNTIRTVLNVIFPLITYPYITRVLSVDSLGRYDFSKSIVSYFLLIAGLGIAQYAVREGSGIRDREKDLKQFCSEMFTINLIMTGIAYVLLFLLIFSMNSLMSYTLLISIFSLNILGTTLSLEWVYTIFEDFKYITIRSIIVQCLSLILMFLFVKSEKDYIVYAFITVFSFSGTSLFNFFHAKKYVNISLTLHINAKRHMAGLIIFFVNSIASMIYLNSDITIIGLISGDYFVGIYSVSTKIYSITKQLSNSVLLVAIPRLSYYVSERRQKDYMNLLDKILNVIILTIIPMSIGIIVLRYAIIDIIAGPDFVRSTISLSILSITSIFGLLSAFFVYGILLPQKKEKLVLVSTIISSVTNIFFNLIFVDLFQEVGAAITTLVAELLVVLLTMYYSRTYIKGLKLKSSLINSFIGALIVVITSWCASRFIMNSVLLILLTGIFSVSLYSLYLVFRKDKFFIGFLSFRKK